MKINVEELSRKELSDIFYLAMYAYDDITVRVKKGDSECYYLCDKAADALINGKAIYIEDNQADGAVYGKLPHTILCCGIVRYKLTYEDVLKGLSNEESLTYLQEIVDERGDYYTGSNLIQLILFGEVIYG